MTSDFGRLQAALSGQYPLERELGSGGMATVYLAEDVRHKRRVAVKVLRPELAAMLGVDRFVREIEIAAKLNHPHILPLFDSGEAGGFLYYVMPYVEGESLRDRLRREQQLSTAATMRITEQVASALTHAHERGVIHRDIKPENILLADDQAIVADFGIARAVGVAGITGTGFAVGTPAYMSPEQAMGTQQVDATTDVYALGCVVYEMLAGRPPFDGPTPQAMLAKHAIGTIPSVRASNPNIPAILERALERALAKVPADRYRSATELASALTGALTPQARIADERRQYRRRFSRILAVAGMVAVAIGGGWWIRVAVNAPGIELLAVLPASNMARDPEQAYFVDGVHEALSTELQRAGIAIIARQSVLQYRNSDKPVRQIADELGVDALIQPAVGRQGDSVFVDVSLYDGQSQLPLWTESFPGRLDGVLRLYRDVSRRIASEVGTVLSRGADGPAPERSPIDPQVYEAVLQGEFHLRRFTPQDFAIAQGYFESALALDSSYAPAHRGYAAVWMNRSQAGLISTREAREPLTRHLERALELDPQLAGAHRLDASRLIWIEWDFEAGEAAFRRAIELDPNDAQVRVLYGHLLMILGRPDEAVRQGELAMRLDPLNPMVTGLHGTILVCVGRTEEAIDLLQHMFAANPGAGFGAAPLADALHLAGRLAEALDVRRTFYTTLGDTVVAEALDRGFEEGGYARAWRRAADVFAERSRMSGNVHMQTVVLYSAAGETELTLDFLERAVDGRNQNLPYIGVIPLLRNLHDHPRFRRIAERVGVLLRSPAQGNDQN